MSAALEAHEPSARYLVAERPALVRQFELLATAQGAVSRLRELILGQAVRGKLVHQDARDEPASAVLERIAGERARLIAAGKVRQSKDSTEEDSPEPPYSLPRGWAWSRLATIGVINPRNDAADDVVASFVQMSSIPVAFNALHDTEARPWRDIKSGFTQFAEGDVGVAKITPCFENGKSTVFQNLSNGIGAGTTELHIVRPLCDVAPRYVLLFLKSPRFLREGEATMTGTAGQKRLPRSFFENCPFPLPPLAEQARIVARVDELMRLCDALEAKGRLEAEQHARLLGTLLRTLTDSSTPDELAANWQRVADHFDLLLDRPEAVDTLEQTILQLAVRGLLVRQDSRDEPASVLLERVSAQRKRKQTKPPVRLAQLASAVAPYELPGHWQWAQLGDLVENMGSGWSPACEEGERTDPARWAVLRTTAVQVMEYRAQEHKAIPLKFAPRPEIEVQPGDILVTRAGPMNRVGISCWVDQTPARLMLSDKIVRFHPVSDDLSPAFLVLALNAGWTRELLEVAKTGMAASQVNVSQSDLKSLWVPVCSVAEQSRILARVSELGRLCANLRQRLTASRTTQSHLAEALVAEVS